MSDAKVCSVEGCGKQVKSRGWCTGHHKRWLKYGDPLSGRAFAFEGIMFLVASAASTADECVIWPFCRVPSGYGRVWYKNRVQTASRVVCEMVNGEPDSPKTEARHLCGKGHLGCVSGNHLKWGTRQDNADDMVKHGTSHKGVRSPQAKLTEKDVLEIRMIRYAYSGREVADMYGISESNVSQIVNRKRWPHI